MRELDAILTAHARALHVALEILKWPGSPRDTAWATSELERGLVAATNLAQRLEPP